MNPLEEPILCRAAFAFSPVVSGELMYMPGGLQVITPVGGGIGKPIRVLADASGPSA